MSTPRLHSLAEFLAVARHRSFTAAAAELGITPSALSQAVRLLEQRVGVTLLTRTTRSVALTEAGRRLYDRAAPGVEQIVEALRGLNGRSGEITGTVRLNVPEAAVLPVLAPVLPVFRARHPGVTVEVHVDNRLVDIVAQGFDAGIRLEEFLERDMVHVRLTEAFRFVVAGSPAYLKAHGIPERPRDLLAHDCIGFRSGPSGAPFAWELVRGKRVWRLAVRGPVVTNDAHLIVAMVEAGMGLRRRGPGLVPLLPEPGADVPGAAGVHRRGPGGLRPLRSTPRSCQRARRSGPGRSLAPPPPVGAETRCPGRGVRELVRERSSGPFLRGRVGTR